MLARRMAHPSLLGAGSIECIGVKSSALDIRVPLGNTQLPLFAQVSSTSPTGIYTSMYDVVSHAWIVRHVPLHTAELTVKIVVLNDSRKQYDVHVAMSRLEDAATIEELVPLQQRTNALAKADIKQHPERIADVRSMCPLDGCVTLQCSLPTADGGCLFTLCGGGFDSDYPICASQPAPIDSQGRESATCCSTFTGWSVTATPNLALTCMAIGIRIKEPAMWGSAGEGGPDLSGSDGLAAWMSSEKLQVRLGVGSHSFAIKTPLSPKEFSLLRDSSSSLRESLDFFYS